MNFLDTALTLLGNNYSAFAHLHRFGILQLFSLCHTSVFKGPLILFHRSWPVSGKFSDDRHRSLYEMLLQVQTDLIKQVRPGISLDQLFRIMSSHLVKGLEELSIIKPGLGSKSKSDVALRFCPHHVGHHLGMDVHDTQSIDRNDPLQPGMCVTVEPGIYIRNVASQRDILTPAGKEFIGIAMRIEDDVLVTPDGQNVLSGSCPKSLSDIERWGQTSEKGSNLRDRF